MFSCTHNYDLLLTSDYFRYTSVLSVFFKSDRRKRIDVEVAFILRRVLKCITNYIRSIGVDFAGRSFQYVRFNWNSNTLNWTDGVHDTMFYLLNVNSSISWVCVSYIIRRATRLVPEFQINFRGFVHVLVNLLYTTSI